MGALRCEPGSRTVHSFRMRCCEAVLDGFDKKLSYGSGNMSSSAAALTLVVGEAMRSRKTRLGTTVRYRLRSPLSTAPPGAPCLRPDADTAFDRPSGLVALPSGLVTVAAEPAWTTESDREALLLVLSYELDWLCSDEMSLSCSIELWARSYITTTSTFSWLENVRVSRPDNSPGTRASPSSFIRRGDDAAA